MRQEIVAYDKEYTEFAARFESVPNRGALKTMILIEDSLRIQKVLVFMLENLSHAWPPDNAVEVAAAIMGLNAAAQMDLQYGVSIVFASDLATFCNCLGSYMVINNRLHPDELTEEMVPAFKIDNLIEMLRKVIGSIECALYQVVDIAEPETVPDMPNVVMHQGKAYARSSVPGKFFGPFSTVIGPDYAATLTKKAFDQGLAVVESPDKPHILF